MVNRRKDEDPESARVVALRVLKSHDEHREGDFITSPLTVRLAHLMAAGYLEEVPTP